MKNHKLPGLPRISSVPPKSRVKTSGGNSGPTKSSGFAVRSEAQPVQFGRASRAATKNPAINGNGLSGFLSGTSSSSGVASTVTGIAGFGGGIGTLISGFASLFGGHKTAPPALTAYQLPTSQVQTLSITGSSVSAPATYGGPTGGAVFSHPGNTIVQTVKQALLNSSSLNDVISEL